MPRLPPSYTMPEKNATKRTKHGSTKPFSQSQQGDKTASRVTSNNFGGSTRTGRIYRATGTELTKKQEDFVKYYVKEKNGTKAAIKAGYSKRTADVIASENLEKPRIQNAMEVLFAQQGMSLSDVQAIHKRNIQQTKHLPTSQAAIRDYYRVTGKLQDSSNTTVAIQFNIES